jgi:hypothetical protein
MWATGSNILAIPLAAGIAYSLYNGSSIGNPNCLRIDKLSVLVAPARAGYNIVGKVDSRRRLEHDFSRQKPHQGISLVRLFKMALAITKMSEIIRAISSTIRATRIAFCIFVSISNGPLKSLDTDATPGTQ